MKKCRNSYQTVNQAITKGATKRETKLFDKEVVTTTIRIGRDGKAVEIIFKDRSKMDINAVRVKQRTPNTQPNTPTGTLQKAKFENSLPGSNGYKRIPYSKRIRLPSLFTKELWT